MENNEVEMGAAENIQQIDPRKRAISSEEIKAGLALARQRPRSKRVHVLSKEEILELQKQYVLLGFTKEEASSMATLPSDLK